MGAAVIYLTSSNAEREKRTYEEIVLAPVKKNLEYGNVISPQFPILLILDLIYAQLLKEDRRSTEAQYDTHIWERIKDLSCWIDVVLKTRLTGKIIHLY